MNLQKPVPFLLLILAILITASAEVPPYDATFPNGVEKPILTPKTGAKPRLNGATIFGVRPGMPFLYQIHASGRKPLKYSIKNLPAGISVNPNTGLMTGTAPMTEGETSITLSVENSLGKAEKNFQIVVGNTISLTPPMGWNSWYAQSEAVSDESIRKVADAMDHFGLTEHGWTFVNIDDCWSGERNPVTKAIQGNSKFPDMKSLADHVHSKGLKIGTYSTAWMSTFAGYIGGTGPDKSGSSSRFYIPEKDRLNIAQFFGRCPNGLKIGLWKVGPSWFIDRDARQFAEWGIDMVKYDWVEQSLVLDNKGLYEVDKSKPRMKTEAVTKRLFNDLRSVNRDIIISLSPKHTTEEDLFVTPYCNQWRLTHDIKATWECVKAPFEETLVKRLALTKPGCYGDLDMLQVGMLGHPNRANATFNPSPLTAAEQYFQVSLWCLLHQPLLLSCDITQLDPFTLNLITNDEVLAVDQDSLGKAGTRVKNEKDSYEVWKKPMEDGSMAIGLFNLSNQKQIISVTPEELGLRGSQKLRDLWRQKEIGVMGKRFSAKVDPHGVVLLKVIKEI